MFLLEILAHAPLQILRLTHIDHHALLVEILVASRRVGQVLHNGLQVGILLQRTFKHGAVIKEEL